MTPKAVVRRVVVRVIEAVIVTGAMLGVMALLGWLAIAAG